MGSSITSDNPPAAAFDPAMIARAPYVKFVDAKTHGYVSLDLTPERLTTRFQTISDRTDKNATVSTLKTWVVESGKPGAVEG